MLYNCKAYIHYLLYVVTLRFRRGLEPIDPTSLCQDLDQGRTVAVVPTFRDFRVLPWDSYRPRRMTIFLEPRLPDLGQEPVDPVTLAINADGPCEWRDPKSKGPWCLSCLDVPDSLEVVSVTAGETVYSARWEREWGRCYQKSSRIWCYVRVPIEFLRQDMVVEQLVRVICSDNDKYFYGYTPAAWLARAD